MISSLQEEQVVRGDFLEVVTYEVNEQRFSQTPQKDIPSRVGPENKTASSIKCERLFPWDLGTAQENERSNVSKAILTGCRNGSHVIISFINSLKNLKKRSSKKILQWGTRPREFRCTVLR